MIHPDIARQIRSVMREIGEPVVRVGLGGMPDTDLARGTEPISQALRQEIFKLAA